VSVFFNVCLAYGFTVITSTVFTFKRILPITRFWSEPTYALYRFGRAVDMYAIYYYCRCNQSHSSCEYVYIFCLHPRSLLCYRVLCISPQLYRKQWTITAQINVSFLTSSSTFMNVTITLIHVFM